jgi:succinate dehydrogenase hydrophobic anchor subunit
MNDRSLIRSFEGFRNRRFLAFTAVALVTFAVVLIAVVAGFRGAHVAKSADAVSGVASPQR